MSLKLLYGLVVDIELHWGITLNYFSGTKSKPVLQVIPPTTIIGALAYPLAKLKGEPENAGDASRAEMFKEVFTGVYYSIVKGALTPYAEISKVWFYKVRDKRAESDAAAFPRLYAKVPTRIRLYYVVDVSKASRKLGIGWRKLLEYAAWSIMRLGSKESIVSVVDVKTSMVKELDVRGVEVIETPATIPAYNAKSITGNYVLAEVIDWRKSRIGRYTEASIVRIAQPVGAYHTPSKVKVEVEETPVYLIETPSSVEKLIPW
ncbi:MAG: type I-A CRISPR-associated protein Cas5 [Thermoprotei archaeon]|nr:MAG: type I-A CRISPR-associated protein Cas5 [Thermoprotei archaeon]